MFYRAVYSKSMRVKSQEYRNTSCARTCWESLLEMRSAPSLPVGGGRGQEIPRTDPPRLPNMQPVAVPPSVRPSSAWPSINSRMRHAADSHSFRAAAVAAEERAVRARRTKSQERERRTDIQRGREGGRERDHRRGVPESILSHLVPHSLTRSTHLYPRSVSDAAGRGRSHCNKLPNEQGGLLRPPLSVCLSS